MPIIIHAGGLALALLMAAPASAQGGGTAIDLECELTIHRNRTTVTLWPLAADVPANGRIDATLSKVGGGGVLEDQGVHTLWRRGERRKFNTYEGEFHSCRADAHWTHPAAAPAQVAPYLRKPIVRVVPGQPLKQAPR